MNFNYKAPTTQMLGRWQPWHPGHRALFERSIAKTGQVCIMIRDCQGWNGSNPFTVEQIKEQIIRDLDPNFQGKYEIVVVPNITNTTTSTITQCQMLQVPMDNLLKSCSTLAANALGH